MTQQEEPVELNSEELQSLMRDAIARHGSAQREAEERPHRMQSLATLEDALEIARDLNIPEEHVLAAVKERNLAKLREQRRGAVRTARRSAFWLGLGLAGIATLLALLLGTFTGGMLSWLVILAGALWLPVAFLAWRWLFAEVSDEELGRRDHIPVAGTCRVCGASAYNERATFCEEHRYRGPAAD